MGVAKMSVLVNETLGDQDQEDDVELSSLEMPLPNVNSVILGKVLDYCKQYKDNPMSPIQTPLRSHKLEELVQDWYAEFVRVPKEQLFELVAAANYMDIKVRNECARLRGVGVGLGCSCTTSLHASSELRTRRHWDRLSHVVL
jgi:hypothetical protein